MDVPNYILFFYIQVFMDINASQT